MKEIVLQRDVRCFEQAYGPQCRLLGNFDRSLSKGDRVWIGETVSMSWDHRDVLVVPFQWEGNEGFLLHDEVESSLAAKAPSFVN